jgi:hypothetical protein
MNNKLGGMYVQNDERAHYTFNFTDTHENKHVSVSFRAEPDYDLDVIFAEIRNFLIATNHDIEGPIGELNFDEGSYDDEPEVLARWSDDYESERNELMQNVHAMTQAQAADKFSMDHFPNNGWPFGGLTTSALPAMTSVDLSSMLVTDLSTLTSKSWTEWSAPTMAPLTSRQVQSWSLPTEGIKALTSADISAWSMPMPGTAGSAQYKWPDKDAY